MTEDPPARQVGRIIITYTIEADGSMTTNYDTEEDLDLVIQLGLLRLAEDAAIRVAMEDE